MVSDGTIIRLLGRDVILIGCYGIKWQDGNEAQSKPITKLEHEVSVTVTEPGVMSISKIPNEP